MVFREGYTPPINEMGATHLGLTDVDRGGVVQVFEGRLGTSLTEPSTRYLESAQVAQVMPDPRSSELVSRKQLEQAFEVIGQAPNWNDPISLAIHASSLVLVCESRVWGLESRKYALRRVVLMARRMNELLNTPIKI